MHPVTLGGGGAHTNSLVYLLLCWEFSHKAKVILNRFVDNSSVVGGPEGPHYLYHRRPERPP